MIPSWKQFFAAIIALSTAFSVVLGCELLKKGSGPDGLKLTKPAPLSAEAEAKSHVSQGLRDMYSSRFKDAEDELEKALAFQPQSAFIHFKLAELYAAQNNYEQAAKSASQAISLEPTWSEPYSFLIQMELYSQKPKQAEELARKLVEMNPQDPDAVVLLSRAYLAQGLAGPAVLTLAEFIDKFPAQLEVRKERARLLLRLGRLEDAEMAYQELLQAAPGDAESWVEYGQLLVGRGRLSQSLDAYHQYLAINPSDTGVRLEVVKLLNQLGKKEEARKEIETAKSFSPDADEVYELSAFLYLQDNQIDKAKQEYMTLLAINPDSDRAAFSLGLIEEENKNWDQAANWFELVPEKSKLYLDAKAQAIWALYNQDKKNEALDLARKMTGEHPGKNVSWLTLAGLCQKEEKYDEGIQVLQDGLKHLPEDTELVYSLAMFYSLVGNNDKALELAQTALLKKPEDPSLLNFIGYTWADTDQNLAQAEDYIKRALEKEPGNGAIIDSLGWVYFKKGRYQDALKLLNQAFAKIPDDPEVTKHLGQLWLKTGDRQKARQYFEKALTQNPRAAQKREIESLLKQTR